MHENYGRIDSKTYVPITERDEPENLLKIDSREVTVAGYVSDHELGGEVGEMIELESIVRV
eukprot:CAMPEP_0185610546 /NCGR_PEP_ID=MMETSP0436-20130131/12268_1 /TAXON_ID=626734 ORGANISM="Favella taraikaensis, Strain Fe Narragansett Bay" /NCGR_SAMPLE_ID=MMETSP0436 /ASSEMBLY_ACC=CAM_ASM_000390 /LENGTH=60 /DNA_ID=CAMNT_0028243199 /DNA_START=147 /DNA_END=329 /DNA_ORIENTATION=+